jgi:V/A-type H+-transporting ATPase subunit F
MKKVAFITPPDTAYGFQLGGISQYAMAEPDNGLVIVDERLIKGMSEERLRELEQGWRGILLVMPSPVKPPPEVEDYAARLIRRAIGYHVKLRL